MKQSFLNRSFFQILVADNQIFDSDCQLFFLLNHLYIAVFALIDFADTKGTEYQPRSGTTEAEAYDEVPVRRLRTDAWM